MAHDIVRNLHTGQSDPATPITAPENIPKGSFLYRVIPGGRPVHAEGVLLQEGATRISKAQKAVSGDFNDAAREATGKGNIVHASHLIPREFGGSGDTWNLVALPKEFNHDQITEFERELRGMLDFCDHYLQVFVSYQGEQRIAKEVFYRVFWMRDGKIQSQPRERSFLILH